MAKFRKKPVEIEAQQWDGTAEGAGPIINWILDNNGTARYHGNIAADPKCPTPEFHETHLYCPSCPFAVDDSLRIDTLEGTITASARDFIIRGVQGEFYPCKPDIFEATYDAVEDSAQEPPYGDGHGLFE